MNELQEFVKRRKNVKMNIDLNQMQYHFKNQIKGVKEMKVITNLGMIDIDPATITSIRTGHVIPENHEYCDLTHCIEFVDKKYQSGCHIVSVSVSDAIRLSKLSCIKIKEFGGES